MAVPKERPARAFAGEVVRSPRRCRLSIDGRIYRYRVGDCRGSPPLDVRAESVTRHDTRVKGSAVFSIVLVHGGFVDGSGWEAVYQILRKSGHAVTVVQNPTTSLADDVAVTRRALDQQPDQAVLVGHSYGGAVITEAGNHPKVAALVYITAFAPDRGESVNTLIADPPPGAPVPPILPPQDGFLFLDRDKFAASFAADVDPDLAAFMADSQVPWGVDVLAGAITEPAWRTKPSWYLVATEDRMIPRMRSASCPSAPMPRWSRPRQSLGLRIATRSGGRAHRVRRQSGQLRTGRPPPTASGHPITATPAGSTAT